MKYILLPIVFAFVSLTSIAQTSEHLIFRGVPIDGILDEYVFKMKKSGFLHLGTEDGTAILNGDFAGYKNCYIGVSTLKQKDLVHTIAVVFPDQETWSALVDNYFNLKKMLTEKYGMPIDVVEKFEGSSVPKDDNSRMYEVLFDRCKYYAIWEMDNGEIQLSIDHNSVTKCFVKLTYFDRINGDKVRAKAIDDL